MQTFQETLKKDNQDFSVTIESEGKEYVGHFTNGRIDRGTLPEGWYAYDLVHGDENDGEICEIKNDSVMVNHFGTFFTTEPLPIKNGETIIVDGAKVDYTFSPDIPNHEPWQGVLPIEFMEGDYIGTQENIKDGKFFGTHELGEFYIALCNGQFNIRGGLEGSVMGYDGDDYYNVELYVPVEQCTDIPEFAMKSDGGPIRVAVNNGLDLEEIQAYRLPSVHIGIDEVQGMHLFEIEKLILSRSKDMVYHVAPDAFRNMFPDEYTDRAVNELVEVAEWKINKDGFERFCDSSIPIEAVGPVGNVTIGNHWFEIDADMLDPEDYKYNAVPYDQICPMIMGDYLPIRYVAATENGKFDFSPSKYSNGILPVISQESPFGDFMPRTDDSIRDMDSFKKEFIKKLVKDNCIALEDVHLYKELKASGKNYYEQFDVALREAAASYSKGGRLSPDNLKELGVYYSGKRASHGYPMSKAEKCISAANEMKKDGYDFSRISLCLKAASFDQEDVITAVKDVAAGIHNQSKVNIQSFRKKIEYNKSHTGHPEKQR